MTIPRSAYDKCHQSLSLQSLRNKKYGMKSPGSRSPFCQSIPRNVYDGSPRFSHTPMVFANQQINQQITDTPMVSVTQITTDTPMVSTAHITTNTPMAFVPLITDTPMVSVTQSTNDETITEEGSTQGSDTCFDIESRKIIYKFYTLFSL